MKYRGHSRWTHKAINFDEGLYKLEIFGLATNYSIPSNPEIILDEEELMNTITFRVISAEFDWGPIIMIGGSSIFILCAVGVAAFIIRRRRLALV
jgi:hypothetical protein